ncbi:glucose-6-phosphate dehydrogenase [Streptomyces sp. NPDC002458]|uniref:glucose-6-phosphate dehydrogenase n=1 Tax=Streptomyces sp. NPDC002458 TaxID=3364644 RepID=UPI00367DAB31
MSDDYLSPPDLERADVLVVFGLSGDLARKMLLPALYRLTESGRLSVPVIGVAAVDWDDDTLREHAREAVAAAGTDIDEAVFARFAQGLSLVTGDFTDGATFARLREAVAGFAFVTYYMAIPPSLFTGVAASLAGAGLNRRSRLVVEKPFGHDLASARKLQDELSSHFDDAHLLRVDHFLGNRAVESLEKWRALHATRTLDPADTVRGQYDGYRDVEGVGPDSRTETYVATRMFVDNWRWAGVPFYLRSGKALAVSATEVVVELRKPPLELFGGEDTQTPPNIIRFRVDGDTGIRADLILRKPDSTTGPMAVPIGVDFAQVLGRQELPYENILYGAVVGDPECFAFFPTVLECWRIVEPVLDPVEPPLAYAPGSWGPEAADRLPGLRNWHRLGHRLFDEG